MSALLKRQSLDILISDFAAEKIKLIRLVCVAKGLYSSYPRLEPCSVETQTSLSGDSNQFGQTNFFIAPLDGTR